MATAKSLKRLRSASSAFLEDGGSLLHGVDGLLQDVHQTLIDLQRREELLVGREIALEAREVCLNEMLQKLADNVSSLAPVSSIVPTAIPIPEPESEPKKTASPLPEVAIPTAESRVAKVLAEIQSTVAEVVSPAVTLEPTNPTVATNSAQRFSHQRKKKRR